MGTVEPQAELAEVLLECTSGPKVTCDMEDHGQVTYPTRWARTSYKWDYPETNSSHLKMDGWKIIFLLGWLPGRCYVSFRECIS